MSMIRQRAAEAPGPVLVLALLFSLAACGESRRRDSAPSVRDSAGVAIVESYEPAWQDGAGMTVWTEPILEIGVAEGSLEYQFTRIEGALQTPDGRVVVADGGSSEIRFFDPSGQHLFTIGRRGEAPGEYRYIDGLGYGPGDSIWVFDYGTRRFTVLDADGKLVRTLTLGPELSNVGAVGRLADGSFVVREYWSAAAQSGAIKMGLGRDPAAVALYTGDGDGPDTIGLFLGREVFIGTEGGRGVMSTPLFARNTSAAVYGSDIWVGEQEAFEVGRYSAETGLQQLIRLPGLDLSVSEQDVEAARQARLASEPEGRREMARAHLAALEVPETRPAYEDLLVDPDGNLWVADYAPHPNPPTTWRVFEADGALLGSVQVPDAFQLYQIGDDWVLGVWRDDVGVERVRVYSLLREGVQ
ncbi:MAG: hypothetical protein JSU87_01475 [Gemmatimonadota bacterium]|nr:MAG: hypothetical protein JSU87_01475 [Gemmatimonadota bacterium]